MHNLRRKVDHLHQHLHRKAQIREERTPTPSQSFSSNDDQCYWQRSKTSPSESFTSLSHLSYGERQHHKRSRIPPQRNIGNDALGKALLQISRSPFTRRIEQAKLPRHFNKPTFTIYNGKSELVEHVSHSNQRMTIHSKNKALMCKVFPSSLGPGVMRWFNGLEEGSISSYEELTRAFRARFVTCSRVLRPLDCLLLMAIREGETLKNYSDRY